MTESNQLKEKRSECKNCNAILAGAYCSQCGQRNKEFQPAVTQWLQALWDDFIAVDAKLLRTVKALVTPGKYPSDWLAGKQSRYIPPIRLYIVFSMVYAILTFFLGSRGIDHQFGGEFIKGFIDGLVGNDEQVAPEIKQTIIQTISIVLLPIFIISAQIFNRHSKAIVSVIFAISFATSITLLLIFSDALKFIVASHFWIDLIVCIAIFGFAIVSAKRTYAISWLGAFLRSVIWLILNVWLLVTASVITLGYFEAHSLSV